MSGDDDRRIDRLLIEIEHLRRRVDEIPTVRELCMYGFAIGAILGAYRFLIHQTKRSQDWVAIFGGAKPSLRGLVS